MHSVLFSSVFFVQNYTQSNYTQSNASFFDSEITKFSLRLTPPAPVAGRSLAAPVGASVRGSGSAALGPGASPVWGVALWKTGAPPTVFVIVVWPAGRLPSG